MRIPNSIFDFLTRYIFQNATLESAAGGPRVQCTGTLTVAVEPHFPKETGQYLKEAGFKVGTWESSSIVSAVSYNPANGDCQGVIRGPAALGFELNSPTVP